MKQLRAVSAAQSGKCRPDSAINAYLVTHRIGCQSDQIESLRAAAKGRRLYRSAVVFNNMQSIDPVDGRSGATVRYSDFNLLLRFQLPCGSDDFAVRLLHDSVAASQGVKRADGLQRPQVAFESCPGGFNYCVQVLH